jgi:hypothetical protein
MWNAVHTVAGRHSDASGSIRMIRAVRPGTAGGQAKRTANALGSSSTVTARCPTSTAYLPSVSGTRSGNAGNPSCARLGGGGGIDHRLLRPRAVAGGNLGWGQLRCRRTAGNRGWARFEGLSAPECPPHPKPGSRWCLARYPAAIRARLDRNGRRSGLRSTRPRLLSDHGLVCPQACGGSVSLPQARLVRE